MKRTRLLTSLLSLALGAGAVSAQGDCSNPAFGPDVIVGSVSGISNYGGVSGVGGYALGTTSCNIGTQTLDWIAGNNRHPVIAQNMYRLENGVFEQIGLSWLKHGFTALQGSVCCNCNPNPNGSALGVGCSDPYSSGLNGSQGGLGPRFEVDAHSGLFSYPFTASGQSGNAVYKRIQVANSDIDPSQHPGASFFGEGHYIARDDAQAGNGNNNASYRALNVGSFSGGAWQMATTGSTQRTLPAIWAWQASDPNVRMENVQVPGEGLFVVGSNATDNGDGTWHYEFAIYNLNSDASGGSFTIPVLPEVTVTNIGFKDVAYHSGEPFSSADWTSARNVDSVSWSTDTFASNPNANALRWSTLYNFRFDADRAPGPVVATLGLFKPNTPSQVSAGVTGPECGSFVASQAVRLGTPANPNALLFGQTSPPVIGMTWDPKIDHSSFFPTATVDFIGVNSGSVNVSLPIGTLLCSPGGELFYASPGQRFPIAIPPSCELVGRALCAQGGSFAPGQIQLTNAVDIVIGN